MGKKNQPQQRNNQNSSAPQHHLTRESGRIRQRDEERQGQNHRFNQYQQQQEQQQELTPQERYANNVNLLVLNLNSNPEQIYRETIGKMLHSMTTPYHQKFQVPPKPEEEEKQEGDDDKKKQDGNDKKQQNNKNKKNNKKQQQQQQTSNDHNSHILSAEKASFFPEDQQTATMLIHFPDKFSAKKLAQKLNQGQLFSSSATSSSGEQNNSNSNNVAASTTSGSLHASVVPTVTLKPRYEPCALRITELLSPAQMTYDSSSSSFTLSQLQQYLSSNPGFLSVSKVARVEAEKEEEQQQEQNSNNKKKKNQQQQQQQQQDKNNNSSNNNNNSKRCFIATYADSGAALQARALMSGRAFHGVHLLLELIEEVENERVVPLV